MMSSRPWFSVMKAPSLFFHSRFPRGCQETAVNTCPLNRTHKCWPHLVLDDLCQISMLNSFEAARFRPGGKVRATDFCCSVEGTSPVPTWATVMGPHGTTPRSQSTRSTRTRRATGELNLFALRYLTVRLNARAYFSPHALSCVSYPCGFLSFKDLIIKARLHLLSVQQS
jgi:hypothetical protein